MKRFKGFTFVFAAGLCFISPHLFANDLATLQTEWANIHYQLPDKQKPTAFAALLNTADTLVNADPNTTAYLIWRGIIKSSYANAKGGLGALSLAESAKADLEQAIAKDPAALQGSALTSLGVLYAKVPGWPIGFGDDDKAKALLEQALQINPDGIDPNYFYAEFLYEEREYKQAISYLEKARQAPARPERASADAGRQQEIAALRLKIEKKLRKS